MSIIRLQWEVSTLTALLAAGFDQQIVEREDPPATWTELTSPTNRLPLIENCPKYVWHPPLNADSDSYRVTPRRSSDGVLDVPITTFLEQVVTGYCSIQDIRDQGYSIAAYPDAQVQSGIDIATRMIDKFCGQWFEPRFRIMLFDRKRMAALRGELHLDLPVIAAMGIDIDGQVEDLSDFSIYNRHLTSGQVHPDDRRHPKISFSQDTDLRLRQINFSSYPEGQKIIKIAGLFGFTEIGEGDSIGETASGSQIPLSYGQTPLEIKRACMILTTTYMATLASGASEDASIARRLIGEKTRDQSYTLASPSDEDLAYGITGNLEVDNLLMMFKAPMRIGSV